MRPKLVLIASLLAAIVGTGASLAIIISTLGPLQRSLDPARSAHAWLAVAIFVPPLLLALLASLFVYRHTARRRKLQAALTVILVVLFSLAAHVTALFVFR